MAKKEKTKVKSLEEILFDCRNISNRKKIMIGSNMRNLRFQILS